MVVKGCESMIYLAENLRNFRKQLGMTQEDVAEAVFVAPQSVSKWERGETTPDIALLPALARLLEVSVDALLGVERIHAERDQLRYANEQLGMRIFDMMAEKEKEKDVRVVICDAIPASAVRKAAGRLCEGARIGLVLVPREDGYSFAMSSQTEDVRPITKALCAAFGGKGGGPKDMTQGLLGAADVQKIREKLNAL